MILKIGMEVVCVNNNFDASSILPLPYSSGGMNYHLSPKDFTIGKLYTIKNYWKDDKRKSISVTDDNGVVKWCREEDFLPIEEWREKKLEILLNEGDLHK